MNDLLQYIRHLQAIEDTLRNAASFTDGEAHVLNAWAEVARLRAAIQAEVDRCEAAYARELAQTEAEIDRRAKAS